MIFCGWNLERTLHVCMWTPDIWTGLAMTWFATTLVLVEHAQIQCLIAVTTSFFVWIVCVGLHISCPGASRLGFRWASAAAWLFRSSRRRRRRSVFFVCCLLELGWKLAWNRTCCSLWLEFHWHGSTICISACANNNSWEQRLWSNYFWNVQTHMATQIVPTILEYPIVQTHTHISTHKLFKIVWGCSTVQTHMATHTCDLLKLFWNVRLSKHTTTIWLSVLLFHWQTRLPMTCGHWSACLVAPWLASIQKKHLWTTERCGDTKLQLTIFQERYLARWSWNMLNSAWIQNI